MTNLPPNAEELVSAYLDGEAAPDEIALVEANDELLARVEQLRALTGPMAMPVRPAPPALKEAHLAAALGLFDELAAAAPDGAAEEPALAAVPSLATDTTAPIEPVHVSAEQTTVTSLETARERRQKRRGIGGLIAAAVAVVLVFAGLAALGGSGDDVATDAVADTASSAADAIDDAADAPAASSLQSAGDDADAMADSFDEDEEAFDEEAMEDDAMEEAEEDAMAEDDMAMAEAAPEVDDAGADDVAADEQEDAAGTGPVEPAEAPERTSSDGGGAEYFVGIFADTDELRMFLVSSTPEANRFDDDLLASRWAREGLFPSCQAEVTELTDNLGPSLYGIAEVDGQAVELHRSLTEETLVVDVTTCGLLDRFDHG